LSREENQQDEAVVFGLSSEGYQIASLLVKAGVPTTIVDENMGMGMNLKSENIKLFKNARELASSETLLGFEPYERSMKRGRIIFVCPKLRKPLNETKVEISNRIREVSKTLRNGVTLVSCLPSGMGENSERIATIEKLAGLHNSADFQYAYLPLDETKIFGFNSKIEDDAMKTISKTGLVSVESSIDETELRHADSILRKYTSMASSLEFCKRLVSLGNRRRDELYSDDSLRKYFIDDLACNITDLHLLASSLETGDPLLYLASGTSRSVEGYIRYLIQEIREVTKRNELKASKVRIILVWNLDDYEMRGDRLSMLLSLNERLRDYFGDIEIVRNFGDEKEYTSLLPVTSEKTNLVIACTETDSKGLERVKREGVGQRQMVLVKANLPVEEIR
jgi:hypothetical protein